MIDINKTKNNINGMFVHRSKKHKKKSDEKIEEILKESLKRSETHDVIFYQAYHMALMDNNEYLNNHKFEENINWYVDLVEFHDDISKSVKRIRPSYSKRPDRSFASTLYLFADHFYNFESESNYLGHKKFTAMTRFTNNARKALEYKRKGKRKKAMKALCYACHFLADMNQPHHVGNQIDRKGRLVNFTIKKFKLDGFKHGKFSNHGYYEMKVKKWIKNRDRIDKILGVDSPETFLLDNIPLEGAVYEYLTLKDKEKIKDFSDKQRVKHIYNKNRHLPLEEYCMYIGRESAKYAFPFVEDTKKEGTKEQLIATIKALNMTEVQLARFLYYFSNLD